MDAAVVRAMAKWPNVPDARGWLSLDRRGVWRLKGEPIPNRAVVDFIARNYASDSRGRWFFQNGPQRVFVDLAYTPWVYSLDGRGALVTHTGRECGAVERAWIDEAGAMILAGEPGPGIVDDRDLMALSDRIADESGRPVEGELLAAFIASKPGLGAGAAARARRPPGAGRAHRLRRRCRAPGLRPAPGRGLRGRRRALTDGFPASHSRLTGTAVGHQSGISPARSPRVDALPSEVALPRP